MEKNYTSLRTRFLDRKKSEPVNLVSMISERGKTFPWLSTEYLKLIVLAIILLLATVWHRNVHAQVVSPYQLSPKWMFGKQAGMSFPIPPATGSPVVLSGNTFNDLGQEASTTICDTSGQIVLYSNNSIINNRNNVQLQYVSGYTAGGQGGQSSTDGAVAVPDPASPYNQYYLFTGNDLTGGTQQGISWYKIKVNPATGALTTLSGPNNVATGTQVMEALCGGNDGAGGYWIVSHSQSGTNQYWAWHVQTTGVSATVLSTSTVNMGASYGSVKLSKCQDRICAISNNGTAEVYTWNKTNGKTGSLLWSGSGFTNGYGCEFSPSGNIAYFTCLSTNKLYHLDISSGTLTDISAGGSSNNVTEMGTMQLGPDDKIYVTNVDNFNNPVYIGVINAPNNLAASCSYNRTGFTLNSQPNGFWYPTIYRGIANIAWLNPDRPVIDTSNVSCAYTFTADFKSYFNKQITASIVSWNFGDGTTGTGSPIVHNYTTSGTYLVQMSFTDASCGQLWTSTAIYVHPSCPAPAPVKYLSFSAQDAGSNIKLTWETTQEVNNNYFDVQRSTDGKDFVSIGKVNRGSEGGNINQYSILDNQPLNGTNYYRLVQYDLDGASSFSTIVTAGITGKVAIKISPNPSDKDFSVSIDAVSDASLQIIDLHGAVFASVDNVHPGEASKIGASLSPGVYVLKISVDQNTYFEKIVKE